MPRLRLGQTAALAALLGSVTSATAYTSLPTLAIPEKMGFVTQVGVGKITAVEEKMVKVRLHPRQAWEAEVLLAEVEVRENVLGLDKVKKLRLAFWNSPVGKQFNKRPELTVGQEGLFFAVQHPKEDFAIVVLPGSWVDAKSATYDKDLAEARHCGKLLARPLDGLKAKDASDRFLTAFMLLARYNDLAAFAYLHPEAASRDEPLGAEESKLILLALAEADWSPKDPKVQWRPLQAYNRLRGKGPTAPPTVTGMGTPEQLAAARAWLRDNAETFRISRRVAEGK